MYLADRFVSELNLSDMIDRLFYKLDQVISLTDQLNKRNKKKEIIRIG